MTSAFRLRRMSRLDAAVIVRAKRLQRIVQFGVGLEGVDIEIATRAGIKVARISSAYSGNAIACAEHCIYMMFGLLRHQLLLESLLPSDRYQRVVVEFQPAKTSEVTRSVVFASLGGMSLYLYTEVLEKSWRFSRDILCNTYLLFVDRGLVQHSQTAILVKKDKLVHLLSLELCPVFQSWLPQSGTFSLRIVKVGWTVIHIDAPPLA